LCVTASSHLHTGQRTTANSTTSCLPNMLSRRSHSSHGRFPIPFSKHSTYPREYPLAYALPTTPPTFYWISSIPYISSSAQRPVVNAQGEQAGPKSRLLRLAARDEFLNTEKYKDYRFTLGRTVRGREKLAFSTTCARAYQQLSEQDTCKRSDDKKSIAAIGFLYAGCAAYSFDIKVPESAKPPETQAKIKCGDSKSYFSVPKYDSSASGATSVESATKGWCAMHDQSYLSGSDQQYGRWDVTQLGVLKRSSFRRRARVEFVNEKGVIVKSNASQRTQTTSSNVTLTPIERMALVPWSAA
jgi:hypothetical protein